MPKAERRTTHLDRKFKGHAEASILVDWLNAPGDQTSSNHVANEEAKSKIAAVLGWLAEIAAARDDELDRCKDLASQVNSALRDWLLVPEIEVGLVQFLPIRKKPKPMCSFQFRPAPGSQFLTEMQTKSPGKTFTWPTGHEAVAILFSLWQSGYIAKIRRCRNCTNFLYQKFQNMDFCPNTGACRRAFSQKNDRYRKARNERDRRNRREEKEREARDLQRSKRK